MVCFLGPTLKLVLRREKIKKYGGCGEVMPSGIISWETIFLQLQLNRVYREDKRMVGKNSMNLSSYRRDLTVGKDLRFAPDILLVQSICTDFSKCAFFFLSLFS